MAQINFAWKQKVEAQQIVWQRCSNFDHAIQLWRPPSVHVSVWYSMHTLLEAAAYFLAWKCRWHLLSGGSRKAFASAYPFPYARQSCQEVGPPVDKDKKPCHLTLLSRGTSCIHLLSRCFPQEINLAHIQLFMATHKSRHSFRSDRIHCCKCSWKIDSKETLSSLTSMARGHAS